MLTTEWNEGQAREVWEQEAREEGVEQGVEQGVDIGAEIMLKLIKKTQVDEISKRFKVSVEKVKQLQSVLVQLSA